MNLAWEPRRSSSSRHVEGRCGSGFIFYIAQDGTQNSLAGASPAGRATTDRACHAGRAAGGCKRVVEVRTAACVTQRTD